MAQRVRGRLSAFGELRCGTERHPLAKAPLRNAPLALIHRWRATPRPRSFGSDARRKNARLPLRAHRHCAARSRWDSKQCDTLSANDGPACLVAVVMLDNIYGQSISP